MNNYSILNGSRMIEMSQAAIRSLRSSNDELEVLKGSINNIVNNSEVQGEYAASMKEHMSLFYSLVDGAIGANSFDIMDYNSVIGALDGQYYDGALIKQEQNNALAEKNRDEAERDRCWREMCNCEIWEFLKADYYLIRYYHYCNEVEDDEEEYQKWVAKEQKFDEQNDATSGLFDKSVSTRQMITENLRALCNALAGGDYYPDPINIDLAAKFRSMYTDGWFTYDYMGRKVYNADELAAASLCYDEMSEYQKQLFLESVYNCTRAIDVDNIPYELKVDLLNYMDEQLHSNLTDSSGNFVSSPFEKSTQEMRELYVRLYEDVYTDDAEVMDDFLENIPEGEGVDNLGNNHSFDEDNINIRFLVYTAPAEEKALFLAYAPQVEVDWNCEENPNWDGSALHIDLTGYTDWNGNNYLGEIDNPRGPYVTLFHEFGHALDDLTGGGDGWTTDNNNFNAVIVKDVEEDIRNNIDIYCKDPSVKITLTQDQIDKIVDYMIGPNDGSYDRSGWSSDMFDVYNGLIDCYEGNGTVSFPTWDTGSCNGEKYEGVTDAYMGVTDNKMDWWYAYAHRKDQPTDDSYWYDGPDLNYNPGREFYAETFSYEFTYSPEGQLDVVPDVFDDSYQEYQDIIQEQLSNIESE